MRNHRFAVHSAFSALGLIFGDWLVSMSDVTQLQACVAGRQLSLHVEQGHRQS